MTLTIAIPDLISPSYFPVIAAVELGHCRDNGIDATIKLVFPVERAYRALLAGEVDYVGAAAHAALYVFEGWRGSALLGSLSQGMYWFLVVAHDTPGDPGDLDAVRGLRIGAAPGPADGLRALLRAAGINPDADLDIGPVPGTEGGDVSFGVAAARALEDGRIDGFWANGMGAEVAVRTGAGRVLVDARRGELPDRATSYTFPALVTTESVARSRADEVARVVQAVIDAQSALRGDPGLAALAAAKHFPDFERDLIAELIARDAPYYDIRVSHAQLAAVNRFATQIGLLRSEPLAYEEVVAEAASRRWPT